VIEVQLEAGGRPVDAQALSRAVERALAARGVTHAEVSLTLFDDADMRALNREHLGHDRPTDVLAFALWEAGDPVVVGDVYLGFDQAVRQAREAGVDTGEELVRLAVHGTLHVTGMDHPEDAGERAGSAMYRLQEALVEGFRGGEGR
jgi:probable rRNA maturation factor